MRRAALLLFHKEGYWRVFLCLWYLRCCSVGVAQSVQSSSVQLQSWCLSSDWCGDPRLWKHYNLYSSTGLTSDLYAGSFTLVAPIFRFLWRKPRVLLAFMQMLLMWVYHLPPFPASAKDILWRLWWVLVVEHIVGGYGVLSSCDL